MIPKIIHLYWGGAPLSYLRYLTIYSLRKLNPDYEINLHIPKVPFTGEKPWITTENSKYYNGKDYLNVAKDICNVREIDFVDIGFVNDIHEVIKSDVFRNYIIHKEGGFFTDTDILFFKPIPDFGKDCDNLICATSGLFAIGFIGGERGSIFHEDLLQRQIKKARKGLNNYQDFGNQLLLNDSSESIENEYPNTISFFAPLVYPFEWTGINKIFLNTVEIHPEAIGIHWYGGSSTAYEYEHLLTEESIRNYKNTLTVLIEKILNL